MAIPKTQELYDPILVYLNEHGETSLDKIRGDLARAFYIPKEEARERNEMRYSVFEGRVNHACFDLHYAGLVERTGRGFYRISQPGELAVDKGDYVDRDYLYGILAFQEHMDAGRESDEGGKGVRTSGRQQKAEYVLIDYLTIENIVELKRQDTRFANMIATGCFLYDDGRIKEVPQEVMMREMSYQEFRAQHEKPEAGNSAILGYKDANHSGKMVSGPSSKRSVEGFRHDPKKKQPKKWTDPIDKISDSAEKTFQFNKKMLDFIMASNRDFGKCLEHLIKKVKKIRLMDLDEKSGVNYRKIQRMMHDPPQTVPIEVGELMAIFWAMNLDTQLVTEMLKLAGFHPDTRENTYYIAILEVCRHKEREEVNALCKQAGLKKIFD